MTTNRRGIAIMDDNIKHFVNKNCGKKSIEDYLKPKSLPCREFDPLNYFVKYSSTKGGEVLSLEKTYKFKTCDNDIMNDFLLEKDQPGAVLDNVIEKYMRIISEKDPIRYKKLLI